jgi:hypothetical protein
LVAQDDRSNQLTRARDGRAIFESHGLTRLESRMRRLGATPHADREADSTAPDRPAVGRAASGWWVETGLAAAVVVGLVATLIAFEAKGYLPSPFFARKDETLMDWFSTAWWGQHSGAYRSWRSVYPPINFLMANLFSSRPCFAQSAHAARACDAVGRVVPAALVLLAFGVTFLAYRRESVATALQRAIVVGLSSSMLYGWERGNLVLAAYPFFVFGVLPPRGWRWLQAVSTAVALNLRPYLLLVAVGWIARRLWWWLVGVGAAGAAIYLASWAAFGAGSPIEVLTNMLTPLHAPAHPGFDLMQFSSSYVSLLLVALSPGQLPWPVSPSVATLLKTAVFLFIACGVIGWGLCCLGAWRRPQAVSSQTLAAISLAFLFTTCTPGGYSLIFLLFLVFLEPWKGVGRPIALVAAYLWCIPFDPPLMSLGAHPAYSWLGHRQVLQETTLTLGQLVRPALVLLMEFGLIGACLADLRAARARTSPSQDSAPALSARRPAASI